MPSFRAVRSRNLAYASSVKKLGLIGVSLRDCDFVWGRARVRLLEQGVWTIVKGGLGVQELGVGGQTRRAAAPRLLAEWALAR